ncbi:MAG: cob(I)yrinic acid a,c-diamide adenosyltransferase [Isosphaeraceae bacterium]
MKIYTKTGDDGTTGLLGSRRVQKNDLRIEAYGTVDELNATIGVARSQNLDAASDAFLATIQDELFAVGSALADPNPDGNFHNMITSDHVERLERAIDTIEADLPPLTRFILPGGAPGAAFVHLARTVCRRAERLVVGLNHTRDEHVHPLLIIYLNRLSDALFVLARAVNRREGVADVPWRSR